MANAIPVTAKAAPKTQAQKDADQAFALEQAMIPAVSADESLQALAAEARKAGKVVIEYPNAVRVDN